MKLNSGSKRSASHRVRSVSVEPLEGRTLMAADGPRVVSTFADNRGQVAINLDSQVNPSTVTTGTAVMFTAGTDGVFRTADDVKVNATVKVNSLGNRIVIDGKLPVGTTYRVRLKAGFIQGTNGLNLDGEFNGNGATSGNGTPGGAYAFETAANPNKIARITTDYGTINVQLFKSQTPLTVANFTSYANEKDWDGTFFHRSVAGFVIQAGGFTVDSNDTVQQIPQKAAVRNEPGLHNTRGTIAMAKLGNDPNSATNEWFFNEADNSSNLDNQNGGFTVFGTITNAAGLAVMDRIAALPTVNAGSPLDQLPVNNLQVAQARGHLDPNQDVVFVRRVAIRMLVQALAPAPSAAAIAAPLANTTSAPPAATNTSSSPFSDASILLKGDTADLLG